MTRSAWGHIEKFRTGGKYRVFWHENEKLKSKVVADRKTGLNYLARMQLKYGEVDHAVSYKDYYEAVIRPSYKTLAERTIKDYEYTWTKLAPFIEKRKIADTNWRLVQNVINEFDSGKTQQKVFILWRKILNFAIRDEIIGRNPCDKNIVRKPIRKKIKKIYRASEVRSILLQLDNTKFAMPFLLECICGLRHEEFCALNHKDFKVEEEDGYIVVTIDKALTEVYGKKILKDPKTSSSERLVVIPKNFADYVVNNLDFIENKRTVKEHCAPLAWTKAWKYYCSKNNIEHIPYGTMRSVYATLCSEAGCVDSIVSLAMGHMGQTTKLKNYQQATIAALKMNADVLDNYINFTYPLESQNLEQP